MKTFVYIERSNGGVDPTTRQIASKLRNVPQEHRGPLIGIDIGGDGGSEDVAFEGILDEWFKVEVPSGAEFNMEVVSKILVDLLKENGPAVLFLGFSHQGMELGPAVGWQLGVPVITGCVALEWLNGEVLLKRPIQGGKWVVSLKVNLKRGAIITIQKGSWKEEGSLQEATDRMVVRSVPWRETWKAERTEVIGISEESLEGEEDIRKAEILVSVGRGLGDPENLPIVKELAKRLGGMVSCSRPVVDLGWLPASRQVGISGKTVTPVIYLALGISGQGNHVAGMDASSVIIAVNKDPLAPIFNVAHYGVVGNILEFVPELLGQTKLPT